MEGEFVIMNALNQVVQNQLNEWNKTHTIDVYDIRESSITGWTYCAVCIYKKEVEE